MPSMSNSTPQTRWIREGLERMIVGMTTSFPQPVDFTSVRNLMYTIGKKREWKFESYTADNEIHVTRVA